MFLSGENIPGGSLMREKTHMSLHEHYLPKQFKHVEAATREACKKQTKKKLTKLVSYSKFRAKQCLNNLYAPRCMLLCKFCQRNVDYDH